MPFDTILIVLLDASSDLPDDENRAEFFFEEATEVATTAELPF